MTSRSLIDKMIEKSLRAYSELKYVPDSAGCMITMWLNNNQQNWCRNIYHPCQLAYLSVGHSREVGWRV